MKIEPVNKQSPIYADFLSFGSRHHLLFISEEWARNFPNTQLVRCAILNNNSDIVGSFVYYTFKKTIFKCVIAAPYTPDIELFYLNPSESVVGQNTFHKEVSMVIADYFLGIGAHYLSLNLPARIIDTQPFTWKGYTSRVRYSYWIDLKEPEAVLWNNLSSEKRKSINKAAKDGLEIRPTTDYNLVYSLILQSLERNERAKNTHIIQTILFSFANEMNSFGFVAYHNDSAIGATFCILDQDKALYLFGGFDSGNRHHGAGVSCMWQSILKAKASGLNCFDFEGSMSPGIERYFREFGGRLVPYFCVEKVNPVLRLLMRARGINVI